MNERIQELRKQASQWVVDNHQPADPKNYTQPEIDQRYLMYEQKFAELIVRECANVVSELGSDPFPYDPEFGAILIKQHFGVEE